MRDAFDLSKRRATGVVAALSRDYAVSKEHASRRAASVPSDPLASSGAEGGTAQNRRAELVRQ